jgi:cation-transporting ATPase 13A1
MRKLNIESGDKVHVLFSGTLLMQHRGDESGTHGDVPNPPDGGCVVYVLRTGFSSSQGRLMRMIEFSTDEVVGDRRETAMLLLILFGCVRAHIACRR